MFEGPKKMKICKQTRVTNHMKIKNPQAHPRGQKCYVMICDTCACYGAKQLSRLRNSPCASTRLDWIWLQTGGTGYQTGLNMLPYWGHVPPDQKNMLPHWRICYQTWGIRAKPQCMQSLGPQNYCAQCDIQHQVMFVASTWQHGKHENPHTHAPKWANLNQKGPT